MYWPCLYGTVDLCEYNRPFSLITICCEIASVVGGKFFCGTHLASSLSSMLADCKQPGTLTSRIDPLAVVNNVEMSFVLKDDEHRVFVLCPLTYRKYSLKHSGSIAVHNTDDVVDDVRPRIARENVL